jgi:hypothetical protein
VYPTKYDPSYVTELVQNKSPEELQNLTAGWEIKHQATHRHCYSLRGGIAQRGSRRSNTWPRGYTPCWQVYANKTRVMPFIPAKSVACMSTSWLLGNVYTAKSCKGKMRDPDPLKLGLVS